MRRKNHVFVFWRTDPYKSSDMTSWNPKSAKWRPVVKILRENMRDVLFSDVFNQANFDVLTYWHAKIAQEFLDSNFGTKFQISQPGWYPDRGNKNFHSFVYFAFFKKIWAFSRKPSQKSKKSKLVLLVQLRLNDFAFLVVCYTHFHLLFGTEKNFVEPNFGLFRFPDFSNNSCFSKIITLSKTGRCMFFTAKKGKKSKHNWARKTGILCSFFWGRFSRKCPYNTIFPPVETYVFF